MMAFIATRMINLGIILIAFLSPLIIEYNPQLVLIKLRILKIRLMKFQEYLTHLFYSFIEGKDAIMGSLLYSIYSHFYNNKPIGKNIASFFMGSVFSVYVAPVIFTLLDKTIAIGFISFLSGLLGMKIMEVILDVDWKAIFFAVLSKKGIQVDQVNQVNKEKKENE
jgi:hypothetical protein